MSVGNSSPNGYSTKSDISVNGNGSRELGRWGSNIKGNWASGSYRIEIWYDDVCLAATHFYVFSEEQITRSNNFNPFYQPIQNNNTNNMTLKQKLCTHCNGTGVSPTWTTVPGYGSSDLHWCDVCKQNVSASHGGHPICPICRGKRYVESY